MKSFVVAHATSGIIRFDIWSNHGTGLVNIVSKDKYGNGYDSEMKSLEKARKVYKRAISEWDYKAEGVA